MAQIKAVLGHVSVETAKRTRICSRHRKGKLAHDIVADEVCLVVRDADGTKHNYCVDSANDILARAQQALTELRADLAP